MKYLLLALAPLSFFMVNCSTIPEIKPYKEAPKKELTIEDVRASSGFYKEADFDDEATTPIADDEDPSDVTPDKVAVTPEDMQADEKSLKDDPFVNDKEEPLAKADEEEKLDKVMDEAPKVASVETPKAVDTKPSKTVNRKPSSFKNGMHTFAQTCVMRAKPSDAGSDQGTVQAGKKLWLDNHNGEWLKAYKKTGTVYVSADCVK